MRRCEAHRLAAAALPPPSLLIKFDMKSSDIELQEKPLVDSTTQPPKRKIGQTILVHLFAILVLIAFILACYATSQVTSLTNKVNSNPAYSTSVVLVSSPAEAASKGLRTLGNVYQVPLIMTILTCKLGMSPYPSHPFILTTGQWLLGPQHSGDGSSKV